MQTIPAIDISPLFSPDHPDRQTTISQIGAACRDIGFLSITDTGVPEDLITLVRQSLRDLFTLDEQTKWKQAITRENYRGFIPFGFFTPNDGSGSADRYEGYKLHQEVMPGAPILKECALYGPNLWPETLPQVREQILTYWAELDRVLLHLLQALEINLDLPLNTLCACFETPMTNMTLLHYPPQNAQDAGFGIHPHKDTDALTIIAPDPVGGLEVQTREGQWITPNCPPGGFIVNIGDMLELWSGGRFVSTPHRVINRSGKERYSFPYFAVPRHDVIVRPLLPPLPGFDRPEVNTGHWSAEIWRTNWPDEDATNDTPKLGTLHS